MHIFLKIAAASILLSGCGSDSNDNSAPEPTPEPAAVLTGVFLDSAVQGLSYKTSSQTGFTNVKGEYHYQDGEKITFSLGNIVFPEVTAAAQITPLTLFDTEEINTPEVVNMLRLLQSLDADAIASNGIDIPATAHEFAQNLTVDFSSENFEQQVTPLLQDLEGIYQQLLSEDQAIYHFEQTLGLVTAPASCGSDHPQVGYTGTISQGLHDVAFTATIIDNCTIEITNFTYDGEGPAVYFYAGINGDYEEEVGFAVSGLLTGRAYSNEEETIKLPAGKTLDDLNGISVWCVDFAVDFGSINFSAPQ